MHDEHLLIRLHQAPPGRAIDEQGQSAVTSYAEEYAKLPLEPLATTGKVSLVEFEGIAEPIKQWEKQTDSQLRLRVLRQDLGFHIGNSEATLETSARENREFLLPVTNTQ